MEQKKFYSIQEAAEFLGVHPNRIRNWIRSGKLPAGRAVYQWRIAEGDLLALVAPSGSSGSPKREGKQ